MSECRKDVAWDGEALVGWITVDGLPTKVTADREMIHRYAAGFNDAVTWEIERYRVEIFEKLSPHLHNSVNPDIASANSASCAADGPGADSGKKIREQVA